MKRIAILVTALSLAAGACGGDDDSTSTPAPVDTAADVASSTGEADDATAATEPVETTEPIEPDSDDDGSTRPVTENIRTITSIDDIPKVCRDLMAEFLRDIEPTVSPIDWENASLTDLESIGQEFQARSDQFEAAGEPEGCNDLGFVGDSEFDLMIDFARTEAPGTVEFLEFTAQIGGLAEPVDDADSGSTADGFASCDEAIEFVQGLIDDYDTVASVPASDLLRFQGLATVMTTCSPDQLEFFNSPDLNDFFGG